MLVTILSSLLFGLPSSPPPVKPTPPTQAILAEGLRLYKSECSSWIATDLMLASGVDQAQVGGYLSYFQGDSVRTIFWQEDATGNVGTPLLASYTFPQQDIRSETKAYRHLGNFTAYEAKLFAVRQAVRAEINIPKNNYFIPNETSLNIVLLDGSQELKAYVITGPQGNRIMPVGNDYLLTFTPNGQLKSRERLHNSYLPMQWDGSQPTAESIMHTHLSAHPYITPTDICSALLYHHEVVANRYLVMSQEYASIFDVEKQQLAIITRQAFEKMYAKK